MSGVRGQFRSWCHKWKPPGLGVALAKVQTRSGLLLIHRPDEDEVEGGYDEGSHRIDKLGESGEIGSYIKGRRGPPRVFGSTCDYGAGKKTQRLIDVGLGRVGRLSG